MPRRFRLVLVATLAVGLGVAAAAVATRRVRIASHVTITQTSPVFAGKVKSPNPGCRDARKVKLHVVEQDNAVVGADRTDRHGHWTIHFQGEGVAHYFASVSRRKEGAAGTIYICKHDITRPIAAP